MRLTAILALFAVLLTLASPSAAEVVQIGSRWYRIDLPAAPEGAPLILALHGGGGNPDQFARNSGLSAPALARGYAVIYPAGTGRGRLLTWNAGSCCAYAAASGVDDLAFLDGVVADARARFGLAPDRLYLTGMSNGSMLAETYAATRPAAVRAVAGVSGTLDLARFPPQGPVALMHVHGTADTREPYSGGRGTDGLTDTDFTGVDQVIAAFLARQPGGLILRETLIDPVADATSVRRTDWLRGDQPQVSLVAIIGGTHVWPGGRRAARDPGASRDVAANTLILDFFTTHP